MPTVAILRPSSGPGTAPAPMPAQRYMQVVYFDRSDEAIARRAHIAGMTRDEAIDLLLIVAAQAPRLYDRSVAFDEETRS